MRTFFARFLPSFVLKNQFKSISFMKFTDKPDSDCVSRVSQAKRIINVVITFLQRLTKLNLDSTFTILIRQVSQIHRKNGDKKFQTIP